MSMNRRDFIKVGGLFLASAALARVGQLELNDETLTPVIDRVQIPIKNLKPGLEGFTIVQLSDIHLQPFTKPDLVRKAVEMSNSLHPDLVVLTGDFCLPFSWAKTKPIKNLKIQYIFSYSLP